MPKQHAVSFHNNVLPWWIRLFRWLWKLIAFLGTSVILVLVLNVVSTWLITPKGIFPNDAPLSFLMKNWLLSLAISVCLLLLASLIWVVSRWSVPSGTITKANDKMIVLSKVEEVMPELLKEICQDLTQYPLKREFILMKRSWSYNPGDKALPLVYYYDDHDNLDDKITILCNHDLIVDITYNNTKRYKFTENFVNDLTKDNFSRGRGAAGSEL